MLTLFYSPGSCSLAPRIVLEDIGEPYDLRLVSVAKGEQNTPAFREINPRGRIPVLMEDEHVLVETVAILTYLAARFPDARLMPQDPREQAGCMSVMSWLSNTVQPGFSRFFRPERISPDIESHTEIKNMARDFSWENLQEIDRMVQQKEWLAGDDYSIADPMGLVYYAWGKRIGLPVTELVAYSRFKSALLARKGVNDILDSENSILLE